jgi:hypothetical protein
MSVHLTKTDGIVTEIIVTASEARKLLEYIYCSFDLVRFYQEKFEKEYGCKLQDFDFINHLTKEY